jgi:hypothetical protein
MDRQKPFFIFDRDGIGHPWEQALREFATDPDERRRALAKNWYMDHRVSREREMEDLLGRGAFIADRGAEEWFSSMRTYHRLRICQPSDPAGGPRSAYLEPWNDSNLIRGVTPFDRLCHVGSLWTIVRRILSSGKWADTAADLEDQIGVSLPERRLGEADLLWLDRATNQLAKSLAKRSEATIRAAARILLEGLGPTGRPWWACFAEEIQPQIKAGSAKGLCEALGLGHRWAGEWLIIWSYPVALAEPLYRPTVAEAADSPYHYPSPPDYDFGVTMPLDPTQGTSREVLHPPLRDAAAKPVCTVNLLFLENFPPMEHTRLREVRRLHHDKLRLEFNSDTQKAWHDRHSDK